MTETPSRRTMAADQYPYIRARLDEIEAEKLQRYQPKEQKLNFHPQMVVGTFLGALVDEGLDTYGLLRDGDRPMTRALVKSSWTVSQYLQWLDIEVRDDPAILTRNAARHLGHSITDNAAVLFCRMRLKKLL